VTHGTPGPQPLVHVVGLGAGGPGGVSETARLALRSASIVFVRTTRHPGVEALGPVLSFDHHYETAATFEEVYANIVADLVEAAVSESANGKSIAYAVPGSPLVAERSVELLRADPRVRVVVVGAPSFLDLAWEVLGIDPMSRGVQLCDGTQFALDAAGSRGPFLVAQCWSRQILSDIKLALDPEIEAPKVTVLQHLGLPDQAVIEVDWDDLDRSFEPDHLTSLWIERMDKPLSSQVALLAELVRTLREKCPWDADQTHASLSRHLVEETYEVLDAIAELSATTDAVSEDPGTAISAAAAAHLEEELGDLLFQIVFHSQLATEEGWFTLADVAAGVHGKLVARHPHVFGDVTAESAGAVMANWELIKAEEKNRSSITDGIPTALPALALAAKMWRKAQAVGLDPDPHNAASAGEVDAFLKLTGRDKASAELVGARLFALVGRLVDLGLDAEDVLRAATMAARDRIVAFERDWIRPDLPRSGSS
jgi:tetrapyrrole methylase family protein / MazG family protein